MLLKTVYQWDMDSEENLAAFREESLEIDRQVERVIYRRSDNIEPGEIVEMPGEKEWNRETGQYVQHTFWDRDENTGMPFMSREEFLTRIAEDLDLGYQFEENKHYEVYNEFSRMHHEYHLNADRNIPRQIVVRAVVEHRDGKPVRAEFLEVRGETIAEIPDPNAGGIIDLHREGPHSDLGFVVEDGDGKHRVDSEMHSRIRQMYREGGDEPYPEGFQLVREAMKRAASQRNLDDRDDLLLRYLLIGIRD